MNWGRAFAADVGGGVVMSILLALARGMGMPANLEGDAGHDAWT